MSDKREQIINISESGGVGTSYKNKLVKEGAFVIDMSEETVESAIEKLKQHKEKGNDNKIVLVGNPYKASFSSIIKLIRKEDFSGATILVEDVNELVEEKQKNRTELLSEMNVLADKLEKQSFLKKASYEYQDDVPRQKYRSGGNNRKMKKRKKARNGRGGKK